MMIQKCLALFERDVKRRDEERFRVLKAGSGRAALDLLRRLQQRNEAVALLLFDHRMPQMTGVETLQEAIKLYPRAKRALLTAYADTDAAIKAINDVQLNHYLLKRETITLEQLTLYEFDQSQRQFLNIQTATTTVQL